jgi:CubicO group peptidase (beta-lactamase class C family)
MCSWVDTWQLAGGAESAAPVDDVGGRGAAGESRAAAADGGTPPCVEEDRARFAVASCPAECAACQRRLGKDGAAEPPGADCAPPGQQLRLAPAPPGDALDEHARRFMAEHGILGLALACQRDGPDGGGLVARGYGYANEQQAPMRADVRVRVASVSKTITAVAIFQLVECGRLRLEDAALPLFCRLVGRDVVPRDPRARAITVRHLLEHSAGAWDNRPTGGVPPMYKHATLGFDALLERLLTEDELLAAPGTQFAYSNVGYTLLGRIVEAASGLPYEEYVRAEIFARSEGLIRRRLACEHSRLGDCSQPCLRRFRNPADSGRCGMAGELEGGGTASVDAAGGHRYAGQAAPVSYFLSGWDPARAQWALFRDPLPTRVAGRMGAAAGWVISARDLVRLAEGIRSGSLLRESSWAAMCTRVALPSVHGDDRGDFGLGVRVGGPGGEAWLHRGNLGAVSSCLIRTPAHAAALGFRPPETASGAPKFSLHEFLSYLKNYYAPNNIRGARIASAGTAG